MDIVTSSDACTGLKLLDDAFANRREEIQHFSSQTVSESEADDSQSPVNYQLFAECGARGIITMTKFTLAELSCIWSLVVAHVQQK